MTTKSYPLHWPDHWPRTAPSSSIRANFNARKGTGSKRSLSIAEGIARVLDELKKMGIPSYQVIISTNMPVRGDGLPYSARRDPEDPGAAVYWRPYGSPPETPYKVLAIDQYDRVADNLAAIAGTLGSFRSIERWGGGAILERATAGLTALPSSVDSTNSWWAVLGVDHNASPDDIESAYRRARREAHPDHGGTTDKFDAVQRAWRQYQEARNEQ